MTKLPNRNDEVLKARGAGVMRHTGYQYTSHLTPRATAYQGRCVDFGPRHMPPPRKRNILPVGPRHCGLLRSVSV